MAVILKIKANYLKMDLRFFPFFITIFFMLFHLPAFATDVKYSYDSLNRLIRTDYSNGIRVEYTYDEVGNRLTKEITQSPESDGDGEFDNWDNCPETPNGPALGTCVETLGNIVKGTGVTCTVEGGECGDGETCDTEQGDFNGNGIGDACECYADGNKDGRVSVWDYVVYKEEFGKRCTEEDPCQADYNEDGRVSVWDFVLYKHEFGKINCPECD